MALRPLSPSLADGVSPRKGSYIQRTTAVDRSSLPMLLARAHRDTASTCSNWFGGMVVAVGCSPTNLRAAVRTARVGRQGRLRIVRHRDRGASLNGVTQAMGTPLRGGESLVMSGRSLSDTVLFVRARQGRRLIDAKFTNLGLEKGGSGRVRVRQRHNRLTLTWVAPSGRRSRPAQVKNSELRHIPRPSSARPRRSAAARARGASSRGQGRRNWSCRRRALRKFTRARRRWQARALHSPSNRRIPAIDPRKC